MKTLKFILVPAFLCMIFCLNTSVGNAEKWSINIDATHTIAQYNPLILGNNINWIYDADGIYDPAIGDVKTSAKKLIKEMGVKTLRFPGGNLAEYYDWKSGIGPKTKRGNGLDYDKKPQKMDFGIDEFLRFCESLAITPVFTIGYANNSPLTAAEIVEYCNGPVTSSFGALRARNGHPKPYNVMYWEIGNEVYHKGINSKIASTYGKKTAEMAVMMKTVDPAIHVGAIGLGVSLIWDEAVLKECASTIDFLIYHRYFPNSASNDSTETNNAVIVSTEKMAREIRRLRETAIKYNPKLAVAVTEYNLDFRDSGGKFINKTPDIQQALFIAECIRQFQLNNVVFATKWELSAKKKHFFSDINFNNGSEIALSPSYYAQQIFANTNMTTIMNSKTISPTISVSKFGEIKNEYNVPVLTTLAGKDQSGRILSVIVINRDFQSSYTVNMNIINFNAIKKIELTSMKSPLTGPADHFIIGNTIVQPNTINSLVIPPGSLSLYKISN